MIRKRGEQRYEIVVYLGVDQNGRERRRSEMFHGTLKNARTREIAMKRDAELDTGRAHGHTYAELAARWLARSRMQESTRYQTDRMLKKHILPALGTRKLTDITTDVIDGFYADLEAKGLSGSTVVRIHGVVRASLTQARKWKWVGENVALDASLPSAVRKDPVVPDAARVAASLTYLRSKHPDLWVFVRLAAATGARRGEVVAFRWSDFSDGYRVAWKQRAIGLGKGGGYEKATKTGTTSGIRLDTRTAAVLRWHRWRMLVRARAAGGALPADGFLFSDHEEGLVPWRPDAPTKRLGIYRRKHREGLGGYCDTVQLRTLRHFVATQLIASGADVRTVANRLGHARTSTTTDIYAAALTEADRAAADTMGKILG